MKALSLVLALSFTALAPANAGLFDLVGKVVKLGGGVVNVAGNTAKRAVVIPVKATKSVSKAVVPKKRQRVGDLQ